MNNTLNISLAEMLFKIDAKAYEVLRNYLQVINIRLGGANEGNETLEDIESRIAEIFNSQKGANGVITLENVKSMISIIGNPADFEQYEESEERQREMRGGEYYYNRGHYRSSGIGVAVNEMCGTITGVLYAFVRVCLIVVGISFVTAGFVIMLSFLFIFFFKIPEAFFLDVSEITLGYLPDFMKFIITPSLYPWIMTFSTIVVWLPLMALIYWGIKMIFWFKAKDGLVSLSLLVVWIVSATVLGLLIFNEGISFARHSFSQEQTPMQRVPDTLYIAGKNRISDTALDNMLPFRIDTHYMLIDNENKELHISPRLFIQRAGDNPESITIRKSAHGSNAKTAFSKAQKIDYNYQIVGDTVFIDDYFATAPNNKWAGEEVTVSLNLADGKVIKIDESIDKLLVTPTWVNGKRMSYSRKIIGSYSYWTITDDGLSSYEGIK